MSTANGNSNLKKLTVWTLLPPLAYLLITFMLFRINGNSGEKIWGLISTPGSLIARILGLTGGFEAGIIVEFALNLFVYGIIGHAVGRSKGFVKLAGENKDGC